MINANKVDYVKVQILENKDVNNFIDFDKYIASIEFNEKTAKFLYGDIEYKSASDIVRDLYIKTKVFYKTLDKDNREVIYNEILLSIAELMFRLRVDLGVNQ
jgi:hypothetical protein